MNIKDVRITLASASPRRHELLKALNLNLVIECMSNFDEEYPEDLCATEVPLFLANAKSDAFHRELYRNEILITADTMVICDNKLLGKAKNKENAYEMLRQLSSKEHQVISGICLRTKNNRYSTSSLSKVYFRNLSEEMISYYIDNYKPFDKAGAYGVQEWIGLVGVEKIEGSYFNIMGLPTDLVYEQIIKLSKTL